MRLKAIIFALLILSIGIVRTEEVKASDVVTPTRLTKQLGTVTGPTNKETYYNLPMRRVVKTMRDRGYSEDLFPYWIREDGAKMLGNYIMVAADLKKHPRGSLVFTSLGIGIVCDTGDFTEDLYDLAVDW